MDETLVRTSVTVDEAVAILLGWVKGPIRYTSPDQLSEEQQEELDNERFSLAQELQDRECSCDHDLEDAKGEGLSDAVIAEKRAAIKKHGELARLAAAYLCAVNDEINKGEQSRLRIDRELSNSMCAYVTLTSLDEWTNAQYGKQILLQIENPILATAAQNKKSPKRGTRMADQEKAIVRSIQEHGHNPMSFPPNRPGKRGVKDDIRKTLASNPLFGTVNVFDTAWDRCRADEKIIDAPKPN